MRKSEQTSARLPVLFLRNVGKNSQWMRKTRPSSVAIKMSAVSTQVNFKSLNLNITLKATLSNQIWTASLLLEWFLIIRWVPLFYTSTFISIEFITWSENMWSSGSEYRGNAFWATHIRKTGERTGTSIASSSMISFPLSASKNAFNVGNLMRSIN